MQPVLTKTEARKKLGLDETAQYVVYTGNMQKNKCIESLIDIAGLLPGVNFMLVGGTPEDVERLNAYAETNAVKNIQLPGRQPIAAVSEYLYAADILIIPPVSAPLEKFGKTVLPFKLFPYLAAGRAIVAPDQPDMRELLVHNHNAILLEPDNTRQNADELKKLLSDVPFQQKLSANAAELSKSLTWEERANKFKNWLVENWLTVDG
jgi:glycosyltransferase involved in cell wall biosynthesis